MGEEGCERRGGLRRGDGSGKGQRGVDHTCSRGLIKRTEVAVAVHRDSLTGYKSNIQLEQKSLRSAVVVIDGWQTQTSHHIDHSQDAHLPGSP